MSNTALHLVPGTSLTVEGVKHFSEGGIIELLKVAYGSYLQMARRLWGRMSNAQRRAGTTRVIHTEAASLSMTSPLATAVLLHPGKDAEILKYMERRDVHASKVNLASLRNYPARQTA